MGITTTGPEVEVYPFPLLENMPPVLQQEREVEQPADQSAHVPGAQVNVKA
jgi:hypothetical protein